MNNKRITGVLYKTKKFLRQSNSYKKYIEEKIYVNSIITNSYPSLIGTDFINTHIIPSEKNKKIKIKNKFYLPEGGEKLIIENNTNNNIIKINNIQNQPFLPKIKNSILMKKIYQYNAKKELDLSLFRENSDIFKRNVKNKILNKSNSGVEILRSKYNPEGFIFQQEFFNSTSRFFNLIYDEKEIFNRRKYYDTLIKNKVLKLKESQNNENLTYYLNKELNDHKGNDIILKLYSMNIKFENLNDNKEYSIYVPFTLLPIFYCYDTISINDIRLIFSMIIKLNKNLPNVIYLDDTLLFKFLNRVFLPESNVFMNSKFYEKIIFLWYAYNILYKVTITLPVAYIILTKQNIQFQKIINYELLFYIYNQNFINWDFYIFNYFFSIKQFRLIISKSFSYIEKNNISNLNINLSLIPRILSYEDLKLYSYCFYVTNEKNFNEMYIIKSSQLIMKIKLLDINKEEYEKEEKIYFNLFQNKKLSYCIKNIKYPKDFLKKFFNVKIYNNREKYIFNFDYAKFNEINVNEFSIKMSENKYYDNEINEAEKNTNRNNENDIYSMDFDIKIIYPSISIYNKTNNGILYETEQISLNEIESYNLFCQTSIIEWPKYIVETIIPNQKIKKTKTNKSVSLQSNEFSINSPILKFFNSNSRVIIKRKFSSNNIKKE